MAGKSVIRQVLDVHRAQLQGVIELRGVRRLRKSYEVARSDLQTRLGVLQRANKGQQFQAHHLRMVLTQVEQGLGMFRNALNANLLGAGKIAVALAPRHLVNATKRLEKKFTGHAPVLQVEQAAVVQGLYKKVTPVLLERYKNSMIFYTKPVVERVKKELAQSLLQGDTVDDAVERVAGTSGIFATERWRAERIVRTETSYAYGVTQYEAMKSLAVDLPDVKRKLIETMDDRTGDDSVELDGQVRDMNDPFVYVPVKGKGYPPFMMPPGRPNDRAVVIPWRESWDATAPEVGAVEPRQPPAGLTPAPV